MSTIRTLATAAVCAVLSVPAGAAATSLHSAPAGSSVHLSARESDAPRVTVDGAVQNVLDLKIADLRKLPLVTQKVTFTTSTGTETHWFRGPLLVDVLQQAVPAFDPDVKNDQLHFAVVVTATDGYRTVLSYGELDPGFGGTRSLLAFRQDGQALERPRLTVPGDERGGRYVTDVVSVRLVAVA